MPTPSEALRDRWLTSLLPRIESGGWSAHGARRAAEEAGLGPGEQALAAPNGVTDLIDHMFNAATSEMQHSLDQTDLAALRTHERVAAGLKSWLKALDTHKSAVRKAAGLGLLPWGAGAAARRVWSVSDAIWMVAGDTATDYNRQTKRALLSAVIPSTVLYWLDHDDEDALDAFITRRLQQAMKVGQVGGQLIGPALDFVQDLKAKRPKRDL